MRVKKFIKGKRIRSLNELAKIIAWPSGTWVYIMHKAYHPGWVVSLKFHTILLYVSRKQLWVAKINPKYKKKVKNEEED
jgi:hypothetical protein